MVLLIGLLIIPAVLFIILKLNKSETRKTIRVLLNLSLVLISLSYLILAFGLNVEPFTFVIQDASDYFIYSALIFVFSPFLWIILYHYCRKLFRNIRVQKNAKIKSVREYIYWRDDLNKITPSTIMFTSMMDIDMRRCLAATVLKLQLTGHVEEVNNELRCTGEDESQLLESEQMVLKLVRESRINEKQYKKLVEKETTDNKYIRKNSGGVFLKLLKILIALITPVVLIGSSFELDSYVHNNHKYWVLDNVRYVKINNHEAVENLYYNEIRDMEDYRHSYDSDGNIHYSYNLVRADKLIYSYVLMVRALHIVNTFALAFSVLSVFVALFSIIEQVKFFNKNYKRTMKGYKLLNEAYALKNYLKDFSLIRERTMEEVVIWEYYLVYAIILDINVKVEDKIIEEYLRNAEFYIWDSQEKASQRSGL